MTQLCWAWETPRLASRAGILVPPKHRVRRTEAEWTAVRPLLRRISSDANIPETTGRVFVSGGSVERGCAVKAV